MSQKIFTESNYTLDMRFHAGWLQGKDWNLMEIFESKLYEFGGMDKQKPSTMLSPATCNLVPIESKLVPEVCKFSEEK